MKPNYKKLLVEIEGIFYPIFVDFRDYSSRKMIIKLVDNFILVRCSRSISNDEIIRLTRDSEFFQKTIKILEKRNLINFARSEFFLFGKKYVYNLVETKKKLFLQSQNLVFPIRRSKNMNLNIQKTILNFFAEYLQKRTNFWSKKLGIPDYLVKISPKNHAWGTNYRCQKIYYSTYLLPFSKEIIDYVIVHELCHHFFGNHGKQFWEKVAFFLPNYKDLIKKLNDYEFN
ncbi:YgjP-like metallopeptidase domain-containing protein [Mycoplasma sp. 'Moose RK']|uniref:YgjP-like metallopeptidase domain-containing protein n=1 Tax=Mycoplasma sp. 'Moose RK' TaxID=2780095 RepID=UPI0018C2219E|nr:YgjP-like metallopeptidase domain-containing protein [Mycoplasma sp. 'Moose RK']MBG0730644.1 DUF45 domain-containing protein [Mycoplasma sp. 'Moose RK']